MNARTLRFRPAKLSTRQLEEARVTARRADGAWQLNNGQVARCALSCLIRPMAGDLVLVAGDEHCHILHILERGSADATLEAPGIQQLSVEQETLHLIAHRQLSLNSLGDMDQATLGCLRQSAQNQLVQVAQTLVEKAGNRVSQARIHTQQAEELMQMHGGQVLLSADHDLRADAERINLG